MFEYKYPRPAVATDIILIANYPENPEVMLIQRKDDPFKDSWAFPGGFLDMDETVEVCAVRELEEETGLVNIALKQYYTASKVDRDPRGRVITVIFYGFINSKEEVKPVANDDAKAVDWFKLDDLPNLAFDHNETINLFKLKLTSGKLLLD